MKYNQKNNYINESAHLICVVGHTIYEYIYKELAEKHHEKIAPSHGDIISILLMHEPLSMTELSKKIYRDRSTVTALVKKLENLEYVILRKNHTDSRSRLVYLTEKGRALEPVFNAISNQLYKKIWENISEEDKELTRKTLSQIYTNFIKD